MALARPSPLGGDDWTTARARAERRQQRNRWLRWQWRVGRLTKGASWDARASVLEKVTALTAGDVVLGDATLSIPAGASRTTRPSPSRQHSGADLPDADTVKGLLYRLGPDWHGVPDARPAHLALGPGSPARTRKAVIAWLERGHEHLAGPPTTPSTRTRSHPADIMQFHDGSQCAQRRGAERRGFRCGGDVGSARGRHRRVRFAEEA